MNRTDHLQWAKDRAIELVNQGDLVGAFASLTSDFGLHDDLSSALELQTSLGAMQLVGGHLNTAHDMEKWIEGFN